jgi:glutamate racemase
MTTSPSTADAPIGIFDSGLGGLSILRHVRAQLLHEHLIYVADTGFAPYGDKPEHVVAERSLAVARFLVAHGIKALVVACNTATIAAVTLLREHFPNMPIVGVEPGLKPAAAASANGKIGVLATGRTLAGDKFLRLRDQVSAATHAEFLLQPCSGLVERIEANDAEGTSAMLRRYVTPLVEQGVDTLVLGCTHYPLVKASIEHAAAQAGAPGITLIDTGEAVARQLVRLLETRGLLRQDATPGALEAWTSASATALSASFNLLIGIDPPVREATFDAA